jgi:hypothetical protein
LISLSRRTIGLLAFGEMGAGIAAAFTRGGIRVVGVLNGRSHISRERAIKAGVDDLTDLGKLVRQSEIVFSIAPSNVAVEIAQRIAELASRSRRDLMFVETNPVSREKYWSWKDNNIGQAVKSEQGESQSSKAKYISEERRSIDSLCPHRRSPPQNQRLRRQL